MAPEVADKWIDLGVQLLDPSQVERLSIIKVDYGNDVLRCSQQMFSYWLHSTPNTSWNHLLVALRSPSVSLNILAENIEQLLLEKQSK